MSCVWNRRIQENIKLRNLKYRKQRSLSYKTQWCKSQQVSRQAVLNYQASQLGHIINANVHLTEYTQRTPGRQCTHLGGQCRRVRCAASLGWMAKLHLKSILQRIVTKILTATFIYLIWCKSVVSHILKVGTIIITISEKFPNNNFE